MMKKSLLGALAFGLATSTSAFAQTEIFGILFIVLLAKKKPAPKSARRKPRRAS